MRIKVFKCKKGLYKKVKSVKKVSILCIYGKKCEKKWVFFCIYGKNNLILSKFSIFLAEGLKDLWEGLISGYWVIAWVFFDCKLGVILNGESGLLAFWGKNGV